MMETDIIDTLQRVQVF